MREGSVVRLVAEHPYHTDDPEHLSFPARAIITAKPGQDGNALWYGNYRNTSGWFAASYCRLQPATCQRFARHRPHASFSGFPSRRERPASPNRTKSWNEALFSCDVWSTTGSSHSTSQKSEDDSQTLLNKKVNRLCEHEPNLAADKNSNASPALPSKHSSKPPRALMRRILPSGQHANEQPSRSTNRVGKFRNMLVFNKDRSLRQPSGTPPVPRKDTARPLKDVTRTTRTSSPEPTVPVDPIEVWAAEYRMRQQKLQTAA